MMKRLIVPLAIFGMPWMTVDGQVQLPNVAFRHDTASRTVVSANEAAYHVAVVSARATRGVPDAMTDSIKDILSSSANRWVQRLATEVPSGIQLDSYGHLRVTEGEEVQAQHVFATRLATRALSPEERGFTYLSAVSAFAEIATPERLAISERYMAGLDSLGDTVAALQFKAHRLLASTYYSEGRHADVLRHGMRAVELVGKMEFVDRRLMYRDARFYAELVDVIAGGPNAPANIDALQRTLRAATEPSAALVRFDSSFVQKAAGYRMSLQQMTTVGARLGTKAQDIEGNYWVNRANNGPYTMSLSDGKIHVLEMGHYTCPQCRAAMTMLQRVQDQFPDIQVVSATATQGSWGNRTVEPEVEAEHLCEFYQGKMRIRFPLSIWKGELKPTEDGGMLPENYGPNFGHYPLADKPNIYVIDGTGIIRRVFVGTMTPEREGDLVRLLKFLQNERRG